MGTSLGLFLLVIAACGNAGAAAYFAMEKKPAILVAVNTTFAFFFTIISLVIAMAEIVKQIK